MDFEKQVINQWNNFFSQSEKKKTKKSRFELSEELGQDIQHKPTFQREEARQTINSGAFWHSKGDFELEHALGECKQRGTVNSKGEKQITIQKAWLDKLRDEAFQQNKPYWYLSFGFKGDSEIYLIKPYNHEMELVFKLREAQEEIERLQNRIRELEEGDTE